MQIWVGITNLELTSLDLAQIELTSQTAMAVSVAGPQSAQLAALSGTGLRFKAAAGSVIVSSISGAGNFEVPDSGLPIYVKSSRSVAVASLHRAGGGAHPHYPGDLRVERHGQSLRLSARMDLDAYLRGVLTSEMPASYHAEALKCQALAARTYALNPRISHTKDNVNVCDSYLCCQYFAGLGGAAIDPRIERAIDATPSQIIVHDEKPILALFSSNAGGHTENYENCFSDPESGKFPPAPISYLAGRPEGNYPGLTAKVGSEAFLRYLYAAKKANDTGVCSDLFSNKFAWSVVLPAAHLESHLHHVITNLTANRETAPFVIPPAGAKFGHIKGFEVVKRGVSGVAIELKIRTSAGDWTVKKELVIRKVFANPEAKIARLNSARIFFDQSCDKLGLISSVTVSGLGFGHGVGLQQTGAQGLAVLGRNYREIIAHYFPGTEITTA